MDQNESNRLIQEIGMTIVHDERYLEDDWDEAAIVLTLMRGDKSESGYVYRGEKFMSRIPSQDLVKLGVELQEAMRAPSGEVWKQALIHITRPGPEINIQFEYDDPKRWALKKVSLDMSDYANSLRPPNTAQVGN